MESLGLPWFTKGCCGECSASLLPRDDGDKDSRTRSNQKENVEKGRVRHGLNSQDRPDVFGREKRNLAVRLFGAQVGGPIVTYPFKPWALGKQPTREQSSGTRKGLVVSSVRKANSKRLRAIIIVTTMIPHTCVPSCFVMSQGTTEPRELRGRQCTSTCCVLRISKIYRVLNTSSMIILDMKLIRRKKT